MYLLATLGMFTLLNHANFTLFAASYVGLDLRSRKKLRSFKINNFYFVIAADKHEQLQAGFGVCFTWLLIGVLSSRRLSPLCASVWVAKWIRYSG